MFFTPPELSWLETILGDRFGHEFNLISSNKLISLRLVGNAGEIVFDRSDKAFHHSASDFNCYHWQASKEGFAAPISPMLYAPGSNALVDPLIEYESNRIMIHYDILGLVYWMLSRLEEVGRKDLDQHQRFPATSSHAFKHKYLDRPIVDEWLHILGQIIKRQWPGISLKEHFFEMKVSHDVDWPSRYGFSSIGRMVRLMAGDVLKRQSIKQATMGPLIRIRTKKQLLSSDPFNTFDFIMSQSEELGLASAFNFICGKTDNLRDAEYVPEHPAIRELMRRIHARGHEIGLHPSYNTYLYPDLISSESKRLRKVMSEERIRQKSIGSRMHFLRWSHPVTLAGLEEAGMHYDSSLSYADMAGFRCGTCHDYRAFNPVEQVQYNIKIRPLIAMECSVMSTAYMGLGTSEAAFEYFYKLKENCRKVGGNFTLLWHNSQLLNLDEINLYKKIIKS
ncbi:MAG: polysaccharide deacetylase family protein [Neptuniibacter sp.]